MIFDPRSREYLLAPQVVVQELYGEAPVLYHESLNAYFVFGYDDARRVIEDFGTYSSHVRTGVPLRADLRDRIPAAWERVPHVIHDSQLTNSDPPAHARQRRALQRAFTRKRVESTKPDIATIANEVIDGLIERRGCDLVKDFGMQLTVRVVGTMMAIPSEMLPGLLASVEDVFRTMAPLDMKPEDVTTPNEQLIGTFERLYAAYLSYRELLDARRADPQDDLASAMLALTDEDGRPTLSTEQVLAHLVGITAAGTDTTAALITNMVRFFTESPDQLELVLADSSRWENAVQEGLRRSAIVLHLLRATTRETQIGDTSIPARSNVWVAIAAANADPRKFDDPLRFDVRRQNASDHLGLGLGRHYCLGAPLAAVEARVALEILYRRLPGLQADLGQALEFVPSPSTRMMLSQRVTW